ncbi:MAG: uroporphyrinogen-III C-methyltransferase [Hyphomicrobiaceae bacterium]|nr:uroporphyrinogen-III C-methyltransferase [Hyphomicrobiaceae bacterium]
MQQLPVCLNMSDRLVVVTGGGQTAARRAETALRAGARVRVVAEHVGDAFDDITDDPRIEIRNSALERADLDGVFVVFAASGNTADDAAVVRLAREANVMVNVADHSALGDFSIPSIIDRSPLLIAVSSSGTSPLFGRLITQRLEATIPAAFGNLTRFLGSIRDGLTQRIPDSRRRRRFLETIVDGTVADLVLSGNEERARTLLAKEADSFVSGGDTPEGEVYLVGGGPGDPDLLTFRALRLMQRADVVVYDRLIGSPILELVRPDAERIYVGKKRNQHALPQDEISRLLVRLARDGKRVLRLKGGDPFIFGRGGEEIELLASEGIPFQIVPGITAASGCSSFAGIPLTHRDHAQACIFVTGHTKTGRLSSDWATVLQPNQTVVVYMGLAVLGDLMRDFIANGADPSLPVAIIENGTRPNQKVATGTLSDIASITEAAGITGPALIIIGTVVTLREKLAWFNQPAPKDAAATAALSSETGGLAAASAPDVPVEGAAVR